VAAVAHAVAVAVGARDAVVVGRAVGGGGAELVAVALRIAGGAGPADDAAEEAGRAGVDAGVAVGVAIAGHLEAGAAHRRHAGSDERHRVVGIGDVCALLAARAVL